MRVISPRLCLLVALAVLLVACTSGAGPSAPTESIGAVATAADPAGLVGIIAIGHSGLTGEGAGAPLEAVPAESWATGSDPQVDSVYLRMIGLRPETEGHVANTAFGGAPAAALTNQGKQALQEVPAPALAIIQTVDNDIMCDGSTIDDVGRAVADALALIHQASPQTKILVAGQLGRPSIAFVEQLVAHDPSAKADLTWDDACSFYDAAGNLQPSGFDKLSAVIDGYEAETARVCAAVANCVTDGGVRKTYVDAIENLAADYNHLNVKGQAAEAALIWPVVQALLQS